RRQGRDHDRGGDAVLRAGATDAGPAPPGAGAHRHGLVPCVPRDTRRVEAVAGERRMTSADVDALLDAVALTPRLLVALDFDGTLSPLVDDPMTARMLP